MSPEGPDPLGKRALFWAPAARVEDSARPDDDVDDIGKYALYSRFDEPEPEPSRAERPARSGLAGATALLPPVEVHCSSCGTRQEVDVVSYLGLHFPFFLWRPGRGFTRFMICPSCRKRAWVSASWTPWSAR